MNQIRTVATGLLLAALGLAPILPETSHAQELRSAMAVGTIVSYDIRDRMASRQSRSWYGTTLRLSSSGRTSTSYFDGNNVGIEMTCSSSKDGYFSVQLKRASDGSTVGTASFKYNGFTKATWTNVGPDSYYFAFSKQIDGAIVTSSDVAMYSW